MGYSDEFAGLEVVGPPVARTDRSRDRHKPRSGSRALPRVFVGADGEGVSNKRRHKVPIGEKGFIEYKHEYRLLKIGPYALESETDLTSWECLAFIADLPIGPLYVSYFFSYDVTMICRGLPHGALLKMFSPEKGAKRPVYQSWEVESPKGEIYEIGHVPKKEFRVRRKGRPHYVVIQDVGTFFQAPFVSAIGKWDVGTAEERRLIAEGKANRAIVSEIDDEVRHYNALEIRALEELMDEFRKVCKEIGYIPGKWEGPGNLASAVLSRHGVPRRKELDLPARLVSDATIGLHFGRFEAPMVGAIPGPIYEYDINSAYPHAMRQLPCLVHGAWHHREGGANVQLEALEGLFLAKGWFAHSADTITCNLPVRRKDGSIHYPRVGSGAWWSPELVAGSKRGNMDFHCTEYWQYERRCSCQPFEWVLDLYAERIRLGKTAKGMVLKLALNSLYGKMAQTKGDAPWFNPIYAGLITSLTRAMLLDATGGNGEDVAMYATDALYTRTPRPGLPIGTELGQWDFEVHDQGMHIVQPGLYFGSKGDDAPKTRGLPRSTVQEHKEDFFRQWDALVASGTWDFAGYRVDCPIKVFLGLKVAFHLRRPEHAGQWVEARRAAGYDWRKKRGRPTVHEGRFGSSFVTTEPLTGNALVPSIPYTPAFRDELEAERVKEEWWRLAVDVDWGDVFQPLEEHWV